MIKKTQRDECSERKQVDWEGGASRRKEGRKLRKEAKEGS